MGNEWTIAVCSGQSENSKLGWFPALRSESRSPAFPVAETTFRALRNLLTFLHLDALPGTGKFPRLGNVMTLTDYGFPKTRKFYSTRWRIRYAKWKRTESITLRNDETIAWISNLTWCITSKGITFILYTLQQSRELLRYIGNFCCSSREISPSYTACVTTLTINLPTLMMTHTHQDLSDVSRRWKC